MTDAKPSMDELLRAAARGERRDKRDEDRMARLRACRDNSLPTAIADRLQGTTPEEWQRDAQKLAASVRDDATTMDEHIRNVVSARQARLRNRFPIDRRNDA